MLGLSLHDPLPEHPRLSKSLREPLRSVSDDMRAITRVALARSPYGDLGDCVHAVVIIGAKDSERTRSSRNGFLCRRTKTALPVARAIDHHWIRFSFIGSTGAAGALVAAGGGDGAALAGAAAGALATWALAATEGETVPVEAAAGARTDTLGAARLDAAEDGSAPVRGGVELVGATAVVGSAVADAVTTGSGAAACCDAPTEGSAITFPSMVGGGSVDGREKPGLRLKNRVTAAAAMPAKETPPINQPCLRDLCAWSGRVVAPLVVVTTVRPAASTTPDDATANVSGIDPLAGAAVGRSAAGRAGARGGCAGAAATTSRAEATAMGGRGAVIRSADFDVDLLSAAGGGGAATALVATTGSGRSAGFTPSACSRRTVVRPTGTCGMTGAGGGGLIWDGCCAAPGVATAANALTISRTEGNRRSGSCSKTRAKNGLNACDRSGAIDVGDGARSVQIRTSTSPARSLWNGRAPVSIRKSTTPNAH